MTAPRTTSEIENAIVDELSLPYEATQVTMQSGRRKIDWHAVFTLRSGVSLFFWLFGCLLDDRHKPSMLRIMLAAWTAFGCLMLLHELHLLSAQSPLQNVVWDAWWKVEGVLILNIGGVGIASYFAPGAAGAISLSGAVRDAATKAGVTLPPKAAP